MSLHRSAAGPVVAALLLGAGCAFGPGEPFGEIDAVFGAELERRGGRFTDDGALLPVGSWEVELASLEVEVSTVRLLETGAGGGAGFDPAKPPPGWYCHAGHCHTPDDDIVSYDEAALIIAGGPSGPSTFVRFPVDLAFDLLEPGAPIALDDCDPDCVVGRGAAGIVVVRLARLVLEGEVRDRQTEDRLGGASVPLHLDLAADVEITTRLEAPLRFDRGERPLAVVDLDLLIHPSLLDGVAFDALVDDGEIRLEATTEGEPAAGATRTILENLEASRVRVDVERLDQP